jgi:hypothetical protein
VGLEGANTCCRASWPAVIDRGGVCGERNAHAPLLPGYAPEQNADELVWSHIKRSGVARDPLRKGEQLQEKIEAQLAALKQAPHLLRSFFNASDVAYITAR